MPIIPRKNTKPTATDEQRRNDKTSGRLNIFQTAPYPYFGV
ncbi:hypothetical protein [Neisseria sp. oral taxon 014]|nr:hypothetical protein [Neisseria sp. oral taxon 014]